MKLRSTILAGLLASAAVACGMTAASAGTLDTVKGKGLLTCGANTGLAGFGIPDDKGQWTGLDVDVCRAMAAAVLGQLAPRQASAIFDELVPDRAAKLAGMIVGAPQAPEKKL